MTTRTFAPTKSRKEQIASRRRQEKIRNTLMLVLGGGMILGALVWIVIASLNSPNIVPARVGASVGDFSLTDVTGKNVRLSDYKGKPILINAWATWCPPCKAEMPLLNQYYQAHAKDGFVLLAVNAGDTKDVTASFVDQNGLAFPVLLDPGSQLLDQLAIRSFPTSVLIGKDGKVKSIHVGMFTQESLESEVSPLLKQ